MRFASIAEVKNQLSEILVRSRQKKEPVIVTRHSKPYAIIHPLFAEDLDDIEWKELAKGRLAQAWEEEDALYDYL